MKSVIFSFIFLLQTSIYGLHFKTIDGVDMSFGAYKGKKILIVNTAVSSRFSPQYGSLEKLYQKFKDSLVIVAFPSNDFNHENRSESQIKSSMIDSMKINYILAAKTSVTGKNISPIFQWLSSYALNGVMDNPVNGDFFKYLIDDSGNIIGIYSGIIDPMDSTIQKAIAN